MEHDEVHVMIDLETLGKRPGCAVLSIGAVQFDPLGEEVSLIKREQFYERICVDDAVAQGYTVDGQTIVWWTQQSDAARVEAFGGACRTVAAVANLRSWLLSRCGHNGKRLRLWGHGSSFDLPILEAMFDKERAPIPWEYNAHRDTRTVYALAKIRDSKWKGKKPSELGLTDHHALHDAYAQARSIQSAYRALRLSL